jgi:hypothetical protein
MQHSDLCRVKRRERQEMSKKWNQMTKTGDPLTNRSTAYASGISLPTINEQLKIFIAVQR